MRIDRHRLRRLSLATVSGVLLLSSCSASRSTSDSDPEVVTTEVDGNGPNVKGGPGDAVSPFETFADCDALLDWTKERLLERVTAYGLGGGRYWTEDGGVFEPPMESAADTAAPSSQPQSSTGDGTGGTSGTNTQEVGVDEGDLSETDGRYVYSVIDGVLRSVDLKKQELVYEEPAPEGDLQMILSGDSLLLASQSWSGSVPEAIVVVYDVADGVPTLRERRHLEGALLSTRAVDGIARVVLQSTFAERLPFVMPNTSSDDAEDEALDRNKEVIESLSIDDVLPRTYSVGPKGQRGPIETALDCSALGHPADFSGFGLTWVASLDMGADDSTVTGSAGVVAQASTVYASAENLYVGTVRWDDFFGDVVPVNPEPPHTAVHMFDLTADAGSSYLASGDVDGTVLNSYSLSEYDGSLRIATTSSGTGFGEEQASGVHVLQRDGDELSEVGAVTGLGVDEQIQAVRFMGDRGYVVTFRQTDPLFVLDLSDPTAPALEGELKVPGYSSYLHPIGDDLLLGVGYAGTDSGQITGTQMSLFDVSDPAEPRLLDTLDLGQASEATFDPHAFLWWGETGQAVVPRELVCDGPITGGGSTDGCESAIVVKVQDGQLVEQGRIFQWFPVRRSMIASGDLVTVSAGGVLVSDLTSLDVLADVRFDIPGTDAEEDLPQP